MIKENTIPPALAVAGEMGGRILAHDWSRTPLGPIEQWSPSLHTTVSLLLSNRFPMLLWWGRDYISIYNDAYIPVLGAKHPWGLGKPVRECWSEIWHVLKPLIDSPFQGGPSTWMDDICLIINRNDFLEETHFTIAYSPAPDTTAPGGIGGVLATVVETTTQVINERALETLRKISSHVMSCQTEREVLVEAAKAISDNNTDFPFAAIYSIDDSRQEALLAATAGIQAGEGPAPERIDLTAGDSRFSFFLAAVETKEAVLAGDLAERFGRLPSGHWEQPPHQVMVIPITLPGHQTPSAVLVVALNPFRQPDGSYSSFIRLVTDQLAQALANATVIESERKRAEAIAALDKAKTLFFSNISHEFRTPITLMLGPLGELLQKNDTEWSSGARQQVEMAYRNAKRLLKLVNTLLDFSRIESGRAEARYTPTDIAAYTRNLASNFRAAIEKAGLHFDIHTEEAIGPVYLDTAMWEKIVFNLLSNAFKFTLTGGITVSVSVSGDQALLSVTDTGVGIPEEELANIFNRFHRVQNSGGRTFEGTGIGLSLIRELVQLHGGTIAVESVKGGGSTFTVRIPFGKAHLPTAKIAAVESNIDSSTLSDDIEEIEALLPATPGAKEEPGSDGHEIILIVDDNADMRQHIQRVLGDRYRTFTAANGLEALALIRTSRPSLVLSDLMMPVMDGTQLLRELKQHPHTAQIPVILLTARAGEESLIAGFETGADDYLVKPFSGKELLSRVKAQLRLAEFAEKLEKEVEARTQDLVRINSELESFNYVTSHDLQEPLRKIQMFIDRIDIDKGSTELFLAKINESARRMRQLIESMLAYSRLKQDEEDMVDVDLNKVLADVGQDFELTIEEKKAQFRVAKMPTIKANYFQMNQLFSNLLSNSLKFSDDPPVINVMSRIVTGEQVPGGDAGGPGRSYVQISFCDNGIGFERQYSTKIFDLFQRLHAKHQYSGTGIGLSIVKKIVGQHHGYILAEPGEQGGATFHIWLPSGNPVFPHL
ncbi:MAG TPA: ATP-binding protein [Puia sp.]|nr:ATP-binding protein [Puia sp.]